jgi:hypothetical protein
MVRVTAGAFLLFVGLLIGKLPLGGFEKMDCFAALAMTRCGGGAQDIR